MQQSACTDGEAPNSGQPYNISMLGFNALGFFPDPPEEMGVWSKGVLPPPLLVVEEAFGSLK